MGIAISEVLIGYIHSSTNTKEEKRRERGGPGIREHVKNIELGLRGVNFIRGSKRSIVFPITLPFWFNLVKWICPLHHLLLLLLLFNFIHRAPNYTPTSRTRIEPTGSLYNSKTCTLFLKRKRLRKKLDMNVLCVHIFYPGIELNRGHRWWIQVEIMPLIIIVYLFMRSFVCWPLTP